MEVLQKNRNWLLKLRTTMSNKTFGQKVILPAKYLEETRDYKKFTVEDNSGSMRMVRAAFLNLVDYSHWLL